MQSESAGNAYQITDLTGGDIIIGIHPASIAGGNHIYNYKDTTIGIGGAAKNLDVTGNITVSGTIGGTFTGTVQNNANLTGDVQSTGNATTISGLAVTAAKLAPDSVTTTKIANLQVTAAKIAADTITGAQIAANAIGVAELDDDAVSEDHLSDGAVKTVAIDDEAVTGAKIAAATVANAHLAGSIDVSKTNLTIATETDIDTINAGAPGVGLKLSGNTLGLAIPTSNMTPAGTIISYGGSTAPLGYLFCDGSEVNRTTYADLFAAISDNWGEGNNTDTFNLPNLQGQFLRGKSGSAAYDPDYAARTAPATGGNSGGAVGSIQGGTYFSHTHTATSTVTDTGHTHNIGNNLVSGGSKGDGNGSPRFSSGATTSTTSSNGGGISVATANASSGGNETRPKNAYVLYCIKY